MTEDPDKEVWKYLDGPGEVEEVYGLGYFRKPVHKKKWETKDSAEGSDEFGYPQRWVTKDSGQRQDYPSGMRRDIQEGKPRFDLILVDGTPYEEQMLTRWAALLTRGAEKYGVNNWQLANSQEELDRFRASGIRHFIQWMTGETDEDHAAAVFFNITAYETTKRKLEHN